MKTSHHITIGDARDMDCIRNNSVHLVVTSPPYWQLKDYGSQNQIGFNDTYEEYINNLNLVWQECYRVIHPGCRLCINIGDQFARSVYYGRYKIIPIRDEIIRFCETIGFDFMGSIIWQKVTTCNTSGGASIMGSFPYPRNGIIKIDYEYILLFKKPGNPPKVPDSIREKARLTTEEWNEYFAGHWCFPGVRQDKHLAMFPEELPKRLIRMFSFEGEYVLDPFLGSGTTSLAAIKLGRNSYGYEINPAFEQVIKEKLYSAGSLIYDFEVTLNKNCREVDFQNKVGKLPYIFKDPVKIDKKIDPKLLKFGSKIKLEDERRREESYLVKQVVSPEMLLLDNGLKVRLIGIREKKDARDCAMRFLEEKVKGKRIYLRYDREKFDKENNLMAYVYLQNKTFINMHLIKTGFVKPDEYSDYTRRIRFMKLGGLANAERMDSKQCSEQVSVEF